MVWAFSGNSGKIDDLANFLAGVVGRILADITLGVIVGINSYCARDFSRVGVAPRTMIGLLAKFIIRLFPLLHPRSILSAD